MQPYCNTSRNLQSEGQGQISSWIFIVNYPIETEAKVITLENNTYVESLGNINVNIYTQTSMTGRQYVFE